MSFWGQKSFCLITGGSKGIGREIAIQFAQNVKEGSVLCLLARSEEGLEGTKKMIEENVGNKVFVNIFPIDLSKPNAEEYLSIIKSSAGVKSSEFEQNLLVHNAASIGTLGPHTIELDNLADWQDYYTFNVFSMVILTSQFFKVFNNSSKDRMIVQVTSRASVAAFPTWAQYCSGKAVRNMLMRVIVEEDPSIKTINFAPGAVDTEMYALGTEQTGDDTLKNAMQKRIDDGTLYTCKETVEKLVQVLSQNKLIKGEYIHYSDIS